MLNRLTHPLIAHLAAMAAALFFAWHVSQTALVTTGVQFIAPLLIVITVHYIWLAFGRHLTKGYAVKIFGRSAGSALLMIGLLFAGSVLAPQPAQADAGDVFTVILTVLFCVLIIVVVIGIPALLIWGLAKLIFGAIDRNKDPDDPDERLNDGATLIFVVGLICCLSAEGVTERLSFDPAGSATASVLIDAPASDVWVAMETATAPEFPLPGVFTFLPRPTKVSTDEGSRLGAMRVVNFRGREGAGALSLQVVEQTDTTSVFKVRSDTTPYAGWIGHESITYSVVPDGNQTRLETTLQFNRKLSPAWFFEPLMTGVAKGAMGVLGRDVKTRAEAL